MSRVNTVASLLKRFLSKDDSRQESRPGSAAAEKGLGTSASSASIRHPAQIGSMKITDQVIEEVDEQMTITSMKNNNNGETRPTAQSIFKPSEPIDVPGSIPPPYGRFYSATVHDDDPSIFPIGGVDELLSSSAPQPSAKYPASSSHHQNTQSEFDPKNFDSQESRKSEDTEEHDSVDDDFEKLRQEREAARIAKQKEKLARSISAQQGIVNQIELHELLTDALTNVQKSESGASSPTHEAT